MKNTREYVVYEVEDNNTRKIIDVFRNRDFAIKVAEMKNKKYPEKQYEVINLSKYAE